MQCVEDEHHETNFQDPFGIFLIMQLGFIVLFYFCVDFAPSANVIHPPAGSGLDSIPKYYPMFQDVNVMIFIGFGFLMTFLRKHGFTAVGFNFLMAVIAVQWAVLCNGFFRECWLGTWSKILLDVHALIHSDFCAASILISFGAVLGKLSPQQYVVMTVLEVIFYAFNQSILVYKYEINDVGGSMIIHTFGAYFGLSVAWMTKPDDLDQRDGDNCPTPQSDVFSMIGTLFLWIYWPSFNAATVAVGATQNRVVINTFFSLCVCCVVSFAWSRMLRGRQQFAMVDIQNATLAGGVAIGASADMFISPFAAMLVGFAAGTISVFGFVFVQGLLLRKLSLHDTCGVHNLHGMPGVLGGLVSALGAWLAASSNFGTDLSVVFPVVLTGRSLSTHALYQLAALATTLGVACASGLLTGLLLRLPLFAPAQQLFDDAGSWEVPPPLPASSSPHTATVVQALRAPEQEAVRARLVKVSPTPLEVIVPISRG